MKIEFRLTDDAGNNYQGVAELKAVAGNGGDEIRVVPLGSDSKGLPGHIIALREGNFFREPRTPVEVHAKLLESYHCLLNRVQMALLRLHRRKELRKTEKIMGDQNHTAYVW